MEHGLLVCADTAIIRTSARQELLYPRSKIALAAKAFRLQAIDMARFTYSKYAAMVL
jgi:citrate lyase subunit beta-like protein